MFRDQRPPRHKGSFSLDFGRMGLRHEGKSLAWNSGGRSGLTDRKFRTTNLGSGLQVRRLRTTAQNMPIFDGFSSLFARVQYVNYQGNFLSAAEARCFSISSNSLIATCMKSFRPEWERT